MTANPLVRYPARLTFPILLAVLTLGALAIRWQWTHADFRSAVEAEEVRLFREQLHPAHARVERELAAGNLVNLQRRILGLALHDGITDAWLVDSRLKVVAALARVEVGRSLPGVLTGQTTVVRAAVEHRLASSGQDLVVEPISGEMGLLGSVGVGKDHRLLVRRDYQRTLRLRRHDYENALRFDAAILSVAGLTLALLLHFLLFRRSGRLTVALEEFAAGKLDTRIALEGSDELARIAAAVNSMAQRLQLQIEHLAQLGKLIDQSPLVAIAWRNQAGWPVTFVSENVRQWGYSTEDFFGESFSYGSLIHPDDAGRIQQEFDSHQQHGPDEFRQEYRLRRADGGWVWLDDRAWFERDSQGAVVRIQGLLLDITARKLVELELGEHAGRLQLAVAATGLGTFDHDTDTGIVVTNPEYALMLGYDPATFCESPERWASGVHPQDSEKLEAARRAYRDPGADDYQWDLRLRCADGSWKWIHQLFKVVERGPDGQPRRILGTHTDIQVRKSQEALQERQMRRAEVLLSLPELAETLAESAFLRRVLDLAEDLTESRISFAHFVHDDGRSIELAAWSQRTVDDYCRVSHESHYPADKAGVWADAVRSRRPVVVNDYAAYPGKKGLPEGHSHLQRLVSVPVIEGDSVVMLIGVGNKASSYDDDDVNTLRLVAQAAYRLAQRQRALHELGRLNRVMQRSSNEIYLFDPRTWRFVQANEGARRNLGYSMKELRDMGQSDIADIASLQAFADLFETLQQGTQSSIQFTTRHRRKDGTDYPIELQLELTDDQPPLALAVGLDISKRIAMEAEVRKLALLVNQSPVSFVVTTLDGAIEYINPAFEQVSGYSRGELLGQNPRILQSGKTPAATYKQMWAALTAGRAWRGELHNRRKDGREYSEQVFVAPLKQPDGEITHYVAVKEDITEKVGMSQELDRYRHHLEELVRERTAELAEARDRAESATRAKSSFLANMSHEIRTPMNAILGMTYLLLRSDMGPEERARLQKISDAGQRLLGLLNDILDLSRIDAGKLKFEHSALQTSDIAPDVLSMLADQASRKGLQLVLDDEPLPEGLQGDAARLSQVLLNLVGNAIKFTDAGQIVVRVRVVDQDASSALLRYEVEDTGIGIPPGAEARLFDAFEQGDTTTTRKYGGTGLGLAITRQLVELMGGQVGVKRRQEQGSVFWFTVRLDKGAAAQLAAMAAAPGDGVLQGGRLSGVRVLLAEDDPVNQEVAIGLLQEQGARVELANNGAEALELFRTKHFDVVLMDVQMPEMDGMAATRALRSLAHGASVPIVAMTANATAQDREHCIASGMSDFLIKPVAPEQLYETLVHWLPRQAISAVVPAVDLPPSPRGSSDLQAAMAKIGEDDWRAGLARVRGDVSAYVRILRLFSRNHQSDLETLAEAASPDQPETLRQLAHRIKGASSTLGLQRLSGAAEALEKRARAAGPADLAALPDLADGVTTALLKVLGAIAELSDSSIVETLPQASCADPQVALDRIESLLSVDDTAVLAGFRQANACFGAFPTNEVAKLGHLIEAFQFREALALLQSLRAEALPLALPDPQH